MKPTKSQQVRDLLASSTRLAQENKHLRARLDAKIQQVLLLCEQVSTMVVLARAEGLEFDFEDKGDTASIGSPDSNTGDQLH